VTLIPGIYLSMPQAPRYDSTLGKLEQTLNQQRQYGGGHCALQNQTGTVQSDTREYGLSVTTRTDQSSQSGCAHIYYSCGLDAGQYRAGGQWQLD
jgi:hypothetical protein